MRRSSAFFLVLSALAVAVHAQTPEQRVDSIFAQFDATSPGCAVIAISGGRTVFSRGYGQANLEHGVPITPRSIFHVASISKQFTAMSIVLLAQDGRLSLDDDVRRHVPEVPDFGTRITIRHLLNHTSGLRDQWELLSLGGWRSDDPKSEDDILWLVSRQRELNFPPGQEYLYSNTGFTLLGTIVARVSGKSLRAFTEERIFRPLGMTSTHFHDDHTMVVPGRTAAYAQRDGRWAISIPVFDNAGATSLFTTVEDLAKWNGNFDAPVVGGREGVALLHTRGVLNDGDTIPYALALQHGTHRGLRTVGHSGSDAGYRADFVRFPDQGFAFATLCNQPVNAGGLNRAVAEVFLGDRMTPVADGGGRGGRGGGGRGGRGGAAPERVAIPADVQGTYYSPELDVWWDMVVETDRLVVKRRRFPDRSLQPAGEGFSGGGWQVQFTRDGAGRTDGFRLTTGRVRNLRFEKRSG